MPKALSYECQELIVNLLTYFQAEKINGGPLLPIKCVNERVANALQLSLSTVKRISSKQKSGIPITPPKKTKPRPSPMTNIDTFTEVAIRNAVYEMHKNESRITLTSLLQFLKERDIYQGGRSSLQKILHKIGFRWRDSDNKRELYEVVPHIYISRTPIYSKNTVNNVQK